MLKKQQKYISYKFTKQVENSFQYHVADYKNGSALKNKIYKWSPIEELQVDIIEQRFNHRSQNFTNKGTFWTGNVKKDLSMKQLQETEHRNDDQKLIIDYNSLIIVPLYFANNIVGCILLMSKQADYFSEDDIILYERLSYDLGIALINQRTQAALRERVKELTCLYNIAKVSEQHDLSLNEILKGIVEVIPPAWQYPEIAMGRIFINGQTFSTLGFQPEGQKQTADIIINGNRRGVVEVIYKEKKQNLDEGPFLIEERNLIDTIARQVAMIVEQKEAEESRLKLQDQIRHADRLATIGQLAAGVAHELNEPLGNILGLAQLINKCPELPEVTYKDIDGIVNASLNAREVIKKLLIFARQTPPKKEKANLNQIIKDGLYFFEARIAKEGIELVRFLSPDLPEVVVDQAQLNQVLVNLIVNAIQAIPNGGKITIETKAVNDFVYLIVEDTGIGMSKEVLKKIFIPFFTTKDVNEGTGLGLSVVHGIVTSHKGTIRAESSMGKGSRFEIKLPITAT